MWLNFEEMRLLRTVSPLRLTCRVRRDEHSNTEHEHARGAVRRAAAPRARRRPRALGGPQQNLWRGFFYRPGLARPLLRILGMTSTYVHSAWDERLIETDAEALRYRMTVNRLRLSRRHVAALEKSVETALQAEQSTLEALEAEAVRQHEQQQHALKYGQYLSVLSAHLHAASGGSLGMVRLPPESEEVRSVLAEVRSPACTAESHAQTLWEDQKRGRTK